jgi:putative transposase
VPHAAGSMTGADVRRIVARVVGRRGAPNRIRSDNGSEFVRGALTNWWKEVGSDPIPVEAGSPWQNGFIESFRSRLRDELLEPAEFESVADAQAKGGWFRREYDTIRPHSSIGYETPREFGGECDRKSSMRGEIKCGFEDVGIR